MPNLAEEDPAFPVDGVDDGLPCLDLLLRPYAGDLQEPQRGGGHPRGLGDEEAALGGALRVVHRSVRLRHVAVGAAAREGREDHPVGEREWAHLVRRHQRDHLRRRRSLMHHLPGRRRAGRRCDLCFLFQLLRLQPAGVFIRVGDSECVMLIGFRFSRPLASAIVSSGVQSSGSLYPACKPTGMATYC